MLCCKQGKEPQCAQIFLPFLAKYVAKYEASKGPEGTPEQDPMALIDERFEVFHAGARGTVLTQPAKLTDRL
jgi:hypothetical protein